MSIVVNIVSQLLICTCFMFLGSTTKLIEELDNRFSTQNIMNFLKGSCTCNFSVKVVQSSNLMETYEF